MYFDGNDFVRNGMLTVTDAAWSREEYPTVLMLRVSPNDPVQGNGWQLAFDSTRLQTNLEVRSYFDVQRSGFTTTGHAGMSISGNGHGCNTVSGAYQIHELGPTVLISFEQHCEQNPATLLEGCLRYQP
jgi:hypothetical protein